MGFLENSGSIFEFTNAVNPTICEKRIIYFLHRNEICAILAYFCVNLVAMATPGAPENSDSIFEFIYSEKSTIYAKNSSIFCTELK